MYSVCGNGGNISNGKIVQHLYTAVCFVRLPEMPRTGQCDK